MPGRPAAAGPAAAGRAGLACVLLAAALSFTGCGSGDGQSASGPAAADSAASGPAAADSAVARPATSGGDAGKDGAAQGPVTAAGSGQETDLPASHCPVDSPNCVVASGRVIYVEKVDPDGDGDAHFVTVSRQGVTMPGITVFDVRADLRPDPLPGVGDLVGGAGPVYTGSKGQKQIEVIEFQVAR